ncbi:hypothetical protein [uncultured Cohaesibacter sp.]|uniref:hypothetical protein n=1 Tax=uncultured Cohaesibacter sp. TaxID=1002546 RepID=UPI0029C67C3C|nr:hypothetical protein [uncultured Cohaesibacter sp.]
MNKEKLVHRLLSRMAPGLAADLQDLARQNQGTDDVAVRAEVGTGAARLILTAPNLLERQFGSIEASPDVEVSRLVQSLAKRRPSS